jgi:SHS2 domain-containing protein
MEKYKFIDDLTSDVMFEAAAKTLEELFANAAEAMFSVICQLDKVEARESRQVAVEAESVEKLVVAWLQELIGMVDTEEMFFSRFDVKHVKENKGKQSWSLEAKVSGEPIQPEKGETVVKAVTNYGFKFEKLESKKGFKVTVSVDI